uniref:hypothetical protein n=1 Tax=Streptomyces sp. TRM64462 TaxID=2741726 RepID=UPI001585E1BE
MSTYRPEGKGTLLKVPLLVAAALLLCAQALGLPPASRPPHAAADGVGSGGLSLSVTVNTKPGRAAERRGVRTGHPVVKRYRVTNRSGADLHGVTVTDPAAPGKALRCPGGPKFWMRGMTSVVCTSRVAAAPGRHTSTVRVSGRIPSLGKRPKASAVAGYQGVAGALTLGVSVRRAVSPRAELRYVVANPGNRPVYGVRLTDRGLPGVRFDCAGRPAPPATLAAGARVVCVGRVAGLRPGAYRSAAEVRGSDR